MNEYFGIDGFDRSRMSCCAIKGPDDLYISNDGKISWAENTISNEVLTMSSAFKDITERVAALEESMKSL